MYKIKYEKFLPEDILKGTEMSLLNAQNQII